MSSGELGSAKMSLYSAIPEILRSRSACQELDGLERGPLIGRGCAPRNSMVGVLGRSMEGWEELEGRTRALQVQRPTVKDVKCADYQTYASIGLMQIALRVSKAGCRYHWV